MRLVRYSIPSYRTFGNAGFRSSWTGLESEIDRLFSSSHEGVAPRAAARFPVDLYHDENSVFVRAELPGFNRDDIKVEVVDGELNLAATRKTGEDADAEVATFTRSVRLGANVATENISASYENGVLTVTLPKREETKPKKIAVAVK